MHSAPHIPMSYFDNRLIHELPVEANAQAFDHQPRQVEGAIWSPIQATAVSSPRLLIYSSDLLKGMGLTDTQVSSEPYVQALAGNRLLEGMQSYATVYGGHQFGHWAGQLGDGRAIGLGEWVNEGQRFEMQLKGAGRTPYSRHADGRAVLRSSMREFLCSEAMYHLHVPTTRALSLVLTGDEVMRDMFYDGRAALEQGAIVCRVAPSFLRFGHFELPAYRQDTVLLDRLVRFTIDRDFPELEGSHEQKFAAWFKTVCERTAVLVNEWFRVGFVHGVMNTDNMSILGLTIDYGPYGWMEPLDFNWTPNTTDASNHRYAFGKQAGVARWNLHKLAQALILVAPDQEVLIDGLKAFDALYQVRLESTLAAKLGLNEFETADHELVNQLFDWMQKAEVDYTLLFRGLADVARADDAKALIQRIQHVFYDQAKVTEHSDSIIAWLLRYQQRVQKQKSSDAERRLSMNQCNPLFILRNYLVQMAIEQAGRGDYTMMHRLQEVSRMPYEYQETYADWYSKRPDWARDKAGCSMLSCSS